MMTWGAFRDQIRRSILSDPILSEDVMPNWTNDQLKDCVSWALDTFCAHTAPMVEVAYSAETVKSDGEPPITYDMAVDRDFTLPDDVFDDIAHTGMVYYTRNGSRVYLDPIFNTLRIDPQSTDVGFYEWPQGTLHILDNLQEGDVLTLRYFGYYPHPEEDEDTITIPRWAYMPVAYLTGAYALGPVGVQSATIDRWKDRMDSGNPEQNALREQQSWMLKMYENAINRVHTQDRVNTFRQEDAWR